MADPIRMKAKLKNGVTTVKAIIRHPMERGGTVSNEEGETKTVAPKFIQTIKIDHNGTAIASADWSAGVSENPFYEFKLNGAAKGDKIKLTWTDNTGESLSGEVAVK